MPNPNKVSKETLDQLADMSDAVKANAIQEAEFEEVVVTEEPKSDYTEEELAQYQKMMEAINNMSLKQLQSWQRKANDIKTPQKEKALAKRRKANKTKNVQKKRMRALSRKK